MTHKYLVALTLSVGLLSGCAIGPDFERPAVALPAQWTPGQPGAGASSASTPVAQSQGAAWWDVFHDPELSRLEARVADQNLDIQIATARLAQSRANERIAGAAELPSVEASGSYSRELASNNGVMSLLGGSLPGAGQAASGAGSGVAVVPGSRSGTQGAAPFSLWQAGFDASWELDIWGRARRSVEAARAAGQAQEENRRDVLISTLAEVARDYIQLRGTQSDLKVTRENLAAAEDFLRVTQQRSVHGLATELDVASAAAQVSATRELLPRLDEQESETLNRLSFLLGQAPGALREELAKTEPIPPVPPLVPVGIPSEVVRRRPDIR
ncbi:MAG: TolC family protein, partial [Burkholderiaceae bacterium]